MTVEWLRERQATHEKLGLVETMAECLIQFCRPGEFVVYCQPYRWHDLVPGQVHGRLGGGFPISHGNEALSLQQLCKEQGWEIVDNFEWLGIVRPATD